MLTRRHFLQSMAAVAGAATAWDSLMAPIQRAIAIEPDVGSSFLDAEHIVVLMQENRSFDHAFGMLRGVRGFNDPRSVIQPDGNPVWVQANKAGEHYVPFRLDMNETKTTWMGCLPHSWTDQVDAANGGKHDRWLETKAVGGSYAKMPLTMGYHTRDDLPFYYALADAFTVCDQNFCSTLTGTTPNRLHLWTGTARREQKPDAQVIVRNGDCEYGAWADWTTFPERLEDHGVSWKIYQNELCVPNGLTGEAESWLSNFGDSPIEWFTQYNVRFHATHRSYLQERLKTSETEIAKVEEQLKSTEGDERSKLQKKLSDLKSENSRLLQAIEMYSEENYAKLSEKARRLHEKAFCTNSADPDYRELEDFVYEFEGQERKMKIPKGDVLHQFRKDVANGTLPKVSWLVPPERYSDHPCSAWYGQWYLSEVMKILTENPEVWKKTIFVLTYDENDGYYDHVPPFQAPHPAKPETGRTSVGLDSSLEYLEAEQDRQYKPNSALRTNSLGLGYRVPMVIASPWNRGGAVCSQVFDHTSVIQLIEKIVSHQTKKPLVETNISPWRRAVCGDMTSSFQSTEDRQPGLTSFVEHETYLKSIHSAKFKKLPSDFHALSDAEVEAVSKRPRYSVMPTQEPGIRVACPLPYELACEGKLNDDKSAIVLTVEARDQLFGEKSSGAAFIAYAETAAGMVVRHYTVAAGGQVEDHWPLTMFKNGEYLLRVHGPNGFYRELRGDQNDPQVRVSLNDSPTAEQFVGVMVDADALKRPVMLTVRDNAYGQGETSSTIQPGHSAAINVSVKQSQQWYDLTVTSPEHPKFLRTYAGRAENGAWTTSDPQMG
ncbi:phosphocholine-specific phospholipase C [Lacunimicrobium album]